MIAAIDPSMALGASPVGGASEWQVQGIPDIPQDDLGVSGADAAAPTGSDSFGSTLMNEIGKLQDLQSNAADASMALANGTATDPVQAVTAVENAQLAMQLAGQLRSRGADALSDLFHTQI